MVERIEAGKVYRLSESIRTHCDCGGVLQPGDYVEVCKQTSPNRVQVIHGTSLVDPILTPDCGFRVQGSVHKIRTSSLRRAATEVL